MLVTRITETEITIDAPAKVNLFLQVLGKRPDGYHNINSLFQAVSLFDRLQFRVVEEPGVMIELERSVALPLDNKNLISCAYQYMREKLGLRKGLSVKLDKRIPVAAGLAGGSADAAATILACNLLFGLGLNRPQMADIGLAVGSDVPFFFSGGQALVSGRGEVVVDTDFPIDYKMVLVTPNITISTAAGYAALKMDLTKPREPFKLKQCKQLEEFVRSLRLTGNDFEDMVCRSHPELVECRTALVSQGALLARMTGSGPTIFGIFAEEPKEISERFNKREWRLATVEPILFPWEDQSVTGRYRGNHRGLGEVAGQGKAQGIRERDV
jgi:4-diphosphocytidyl-2-C-methyl-D-erythritol kinase